MTPSIPAACAKAWKSCTGTRLSKGRCWCEAHGHAALDLMTDTVLVRRYRAGEEPALFEVYHSAVHMIASRDYSPEQVAAWAPDGLDAALWANRIRGINPFVAEIDGVVV